MFLKSRVGPRSGTAAKGGVATRVSNSKSSCSCVLSDSTYVRCVRAVIWALVPNKCLETYPLTAHSLG